MVSWRRGASAVYRLTWLRRSRGEDRIGYNRKEQKVTRECFRKSQALCCAGGFDRVTILGKCELKNSMAPGVGILGSRSVVDKGGALSSFVWRVSKGGAWSWSGGQWLSVK